MTTVFMMALLLAMAFDYGLRRYRPPDSFTLPEFSQATNMSENNIRFLISERVIGMRPDGRISQSQLREVASNRALAALRHRHDKPAEVKPLSGNRYRTLEHVSARTGVDPRVLVELITSNEFGGATCPRSGALHVIWHDFDAWWRLKGNSDRARRMTQNLVARETADGIKRAAAQKTKQQILDEAAAAERKRCREARGDFSGE